MSDGISIRPLHTMEEFEGVITVQQRAWGMDDLTVVPRHLLHVIAKTGGVVLGAFSDSGAMIGFALGLVSREDRSSEVYLTSHMMGVDPSWQLKDTGYRLKIAQRDWAKAHGFRVIRWTYDPMETRNAALNIRKLGARVCAFYPEYYGSGLGTALQKGLPTDRFLVEWDVESDHPVNSPLDGPALLAVNGTTVQIDESARHHLTTDGMATLPVPLDFQSLKQTNFDAALKWQIAVREVIAPVLTEGRFWINGFHTFQDLGVGYYSITKREGK